MKSAHNFTEKLQYIKELFLLSDGEEDEAIKILLQAYQEINKPSHKGRVDIYA